MPAHDAETSGSEIDPRLPTPEPSSQLRGHNEARSSSPLSDHPSSPTVAPTTITANLDETEDEDDDLVLPSSKRRRTKYCVTRHSATGRAPTRRSTRLNTQPSPPFERTTSTSCAQSSRSPETSTPNRGFFGWLSGLASAETSGDENEVMVSSPTRRRRPSAISASNTFVVDDDKTIYVSDDSVPKKRTPRRTQEEPTDFIANDYEIEYVTSNEECVHQPVTPSSLRTKSRQQKHRRRREEQEELEDDLNDLRDSEQELSARKSRTRGGPVTTRRDKTREHLELLKRRRAGESIPRVRESGEEEEDLEGQDISLIGQAGYGIQDEGSVHSSIDTEPDGEQGAVDEDNFIEDDGPGGLPHSDIPIEFTSYASAKPRELFPHIVEWLVKNKIAPAFSRNDVLFNLAFDRLDDQVKAQAGSRLISSAWNAIFKYSMLARPKISITILEGFDEDNIRTCDACNKTNRPARYDFVLTGKAYSKRTLEPVDDSEDEREYEDNADRDEAGHVLATEGQHFYLGSYCAANAQMGHKLTHWKHHLNDSVLEYLEEQGILSAESIIARDKMNKKKRERQAEEVVDKMEATGVIAELWKDFQNDLEDARLGMEDYAKKGGRSRDRVGVVRTSGADGTVREWRGNQYTETRVVQSGSEGE